MVGGMGVVYTKQLCLMCCQWWLERCGLRGAVSHSALCIVHCAGFKANQQMDQITKRTAEVRHPLAALHCTLFVLDVVIVMCNMRLVSISSKSFNSAPKHGREGQLNEANRRTGLPVDTHLATTKISKNGHNSDDSFLPTVNCC